MRVVARGELLKAVAVFGHRSNQVAMMRAMARRTVLNLSAKCRSGATPTALPARRRYRRLEREVVVTRRLIRLGSGGAL